LYITVDRSTVAIKWDDPRWFDESTRAYLQLEIIKEFNRCMASELCDIYQCLWSWIKSWYLEKLSFFIQVYILLVYRWLQAIRSSECRIETIKPLRKYPQSSHQEAISLSSVCYTSLHTQKTPVNHNLLSFTLICYVEIQPNPWYLYMIINESIANDSLDWWARLQNDCRTIS
jgi:hypothetical protein